MDIAPLKKASHRQTAILVVGIVLFLALAGGGLWALLGAMGKKPPRPPRITLLSPPPPPPPPKIEKKPEPPREQKEIKVEKPAPKQDTPPPSPELKMEGPAGDGPSAFAAGKITNDDLSKLGKGGEAGGLFSPFNSYANLVKGELQRYLRKNEDLRKRRYSVEAHVWVNGGGKLKRFELVGSTGDSDTDEAIKQAMSSLPGFDEAPPPNMPQPIRLRISAVI